MAGRQWKGFPTCQTSNLGTANIDEKNVYILSSSNSLQTISHSGDLSCSSTLENFWSADCISHNKKEKGVLGLGIRALHPQSPGHSGDTAIPRPKLTYLVGSPSQSPQCRWSLVIRWVLKGSKNQWLTCLMVFPSLGFSNTFIMFMVRLCLATSAKKIRGLHHQ